MKGEMVKQGLITSIEDVANLHIIDWARGNGSFRNPYHAMESICSWLINRASFTVVDVDLTEAPDRADWPGWEHHGQLSHEILGRLWWNHFHATYRNQPHELWLSDAPDFQGTITRADGQEVRFWGDFGTVSSQAFALTVKKMEEGDLWFTVVDEHRLIILESHVNNLARVGELIGVE